jgi:hypothetical protein
MSEYSNVSPEQIHNMAISFKQYFKEGLPEKDRVLAELLVDCFAALLVKMALTENHLEDIAYSQRIIAGRQV